MTPNEQTAVEAIKYHLWTYRTGGLSRETFLSFMEKEIALLEADLVSGNTDNISDNQNWISKMEWISSLVKDARETFRQLSPGRFDEDKVIAGRIATALLASSQDLPHA